MGVLGKTRTGGTSKKGVFEHPSGDERSENGVMFSKVKRGHRGRFFAKRTQGRDRTKFSYVRIGEVKDVTEWGEERSQ